MPQTLKEARDEFLNDCQYKARAPASYYWSGEYADMYGQLAIVHAIPLYSYVGVEQGNFKNFELHFKDIGRDSVIDSATGDQMAVTERGEVSDRMKKYLEFWSRENKQGYFRIKLWSEIPSRCGLNASGAAAAALAGLLQVLMTPKDKRCVLIENIDTWRNKPIEDLKNDVTFQDIFRRAWILDNCAHGFFSSGTGPLSSLVGSPNGELALCFTEKRGFDSVHPLGYLSKNPKDLQAEDFRDIEEKIGMINWWGKRMSLRQDLKEKLGIALIYPHYPKDTINILAKLEKMDRISLEDLEFCFAGLFPKFKTSTKIARPINDFLKGDSKPPIGSDLYPKSVFGQSLGLLSWMLLRTLNQGDSEGFLSCVDRIGKFLDFFGVFPEEAAESYEAIRKSCRIGIKTAGLGGGDFVVFGEEASVEGLESRINKTYPVHFSTSRLRWESEGLTIAKGPQQKVAIAKPVGDTLAIGFKEGRPYVLINQRPLIERHLQEWLFAPLLLVAAARNKCKKASKVDDLLLSDYPRKEQLLTELRQLLMTASFKKEINRGDILPSDGEGNVELSAFEKDAIRIDRSICRFESQHMVLAERALQETVQLQNATKQYDTRIPYRAQAETVRDAKTRLRQEDLRTSLFHLQQEAKLTFKHTRIVRRAVELMGWKFQSRNRNWWKRWDNLVSKCRETLRYAGYNEDILQKDIFLPHRGRQ